MSDKREVKVGDRVTTDNPIMGECVVIARRNTSLWVESACGQLATVDETDCRPVPKPFAEVRPLPSYSDEDGIFVAGDLLVSTINNQFGTARNHTRQTLQGGKGEVMSEPTQKEMEAMFLKSKLPLSGVNWDFFVEGVLGVEPPDQYMPPEVHKAYQAGREAATKGAK